MLRAIVLNSLKESVKQTKKAFSTFFSIFKMGLTLIPFFLPANWQKAVPFLFPFELPWQNFLLWALSIVLITFVFYFVANCVRQNFENWTIGQDVSVYGKAIVNLRDAFLAVHRTQGQKINDDHSKRILIEFCDRIKEIFENKSQGEVGVSIKVVELIDNVQDYRNRLVTNLVRDSNGGMRDSVAYQQILHTIEKNTCFEEIFVNFFRKRHKKLFFLCNDLPSLEDYDNSSMELYPKFTSEDRKDEATRKSKWPLQYKSELVVPTRLLETDPDPNIEKLHIIGFICVDCNLCGSNVFHEEYDVQMMQGVAEGLSSFIFRNLFT